MSILARMWPPERRSETSIVADAMSRVRGQGTWAGPVVSPDSAMRLAAVWACVRLLADLVSSLPVDVYQSTSQGDVQIDPPPLVVAPSATVSWTGWVYQVMVSLLLRGNVFGYVADVSAGLPTRVEILNPDDVTVTQARLLAPVSYRWRGVELPADRVWHVPAFLSPGSPVGLSPVSYAAQAVGLGLAAEEFGARWYGDGGHPTGTLSTEQPVTGEQADTIKARFMDATSESRAPVVLGAGLKWEPIQVAPDESQFLESQRWTVGQVCRVFGVPPEMVGAATDGSGSLTYANREQRSLDLLQYCVQPWLTRLEEGVSRLLARPRRIRFNVDGLLRADLAARYQAHATGIAAGFLTVNEARDLEDLPPLPGGDMPPGMNSTPAPEENVDVPTTA